MNRQEILNKIDDGTVVLEPEYLDDSVIGVTTDGRLVYDYNRMVDAMVRSGDADSVDDAVEWIEYNTIRSLPYMGNRGPEIVYEF